MSTGSDEYEDSDSISQTRSRYQRSYRQKPTMMSTTSTFSSRIGQINRSLQDTNRNINAVDGLLDDYKDVNEKQSKAIDRLRDNLAKSTEQLREERKKKRSSFREGDSRTLHASDLEAGGGDVGQRYNPTSPLREYRVSGGASTRRHHQTPGVRFDETSEEVHELHQAVRDLSSDQLRLGTELNQEIESRNRLEFDTNRKYHDLNESISRTPSKSTNQSSQPADRVEQRLREIQNDLRQQRLEQESKVRYDLDRKKEGEERKQVAREREDLAREKEQMFKEVKHMVSSQRRDEEKILREQLLQAESDKARLAADLSASRRRLERSEGNQSALEQKVEKLNHDFHRSKEEYRSLQDQMGHYQQALEEEGIPLSAQQRREQKIKDAQQQQEIERVKMEKEIERMRQQLTEVSRLKDEDDFRGRLQKTEKQREQMLQHINTLNRDLEDKDKNQSKLLQQLQDMTETLAGSERQRKVALSRLEDLQTRLRDSSSVSESESIKVQEQSRQLEQSEKKRADLKTKAQDVIRQLKGKCKRLEKELEGHQQSSSHSSERFENILRENENLKSQSSQVSHRMENLQKEMQDILEKRAEQDEQLNLKDVEISHLKSAKIELDQEVRDSRNFIDKVDAELRNQQAKLSSFNEERLKHEQEVSSMKSYNQNLVKENKQLQEELSHYGTKQTEQLKLYSQEIGQRKDLEHKLRQSEVDSETSKEEVKILTKKLNEEREAHEELLSRFKLECQNLKERDGRDIHDLTRKMKRERVESEAEIQAMKIEVAEQRANCKSLRKQLDRCKDDFESRQEELTKIETENSKLKRRYDRMRASYEGQLQLNEVGDNRASHLNNQIQVLQETCDKQQIDYESCLRGIAKEVDALLAVICQESSEETLLLCKSPSKSQLEGHPDRWLADLKTKLQWAKEEMRSLILKRKKLKSELNRIRAEAEDNLQSHHLEKSMIESDFEKQEDILQQLAVSKRDLEIKNLERSQEVSSLQRQVASLEAHIGKSASLMEQSTLAFPDISTLDGPSLTQDLDRLQELQIEKERINERYLKYQGTVTLLQQQLEEAKHITSS
ncbi:uncharacterized protein [Apostichopus japonicus]|uniref:uncharacterized protein isoform X2 n=1 Tax=Stichopus japonicus TaxID=307972 RepID=UPI003AB47872